MITTRQNFLVFRLRVRRVGERSLSSRHPAALDLINKFAYEPRLGLYDDVCQGTADADGPGKAVANKPQSNADRRVGAPASRANGIRKRTPKGALDVRAVYETTEEKKEKLMFECPPAKKWRASEEKAVLERLAQPLGERNELEGGIKLEKGIKLEGGIED